MAGTGLGSEAHNKHSAHGLGAARRGRGVPRDDGFHTSDPPAGRRASPWIIAFVLVIVLVAGIVTPLLLLT